MYVSIYICIYVYIVLRVLPISIFKREIFKAENTNMMIYTKDSFLELAVTHST